MLRITVVSEKIEKAELKIEGRISGEDAALLEKEGDRWLEQAKSIELDLSGVQFIDSAGAAVLLHWPMERVFFRNTSSFIGTLLETYRKKVQNSINS